MTIHPTFLEMTAGFAASLVLLSVVGSAEGRADQRRTASRHFVNTIHPIVVHPIHGAGSSHNPIVNVVRDHRGSGGAAQGGVTVDGRPAKTIPRCYSNWHPCGFHHHRGFQGDVRDHRGS
jgi:hypothetical protein